jgi:hypothetical protein
MNESAEARYAAMAKQHGFNDMPHATYFNGRAYTATVASRSTNAKTNPGNEVNGELIGNYAAIIESLGPFLVACTIASQAQGVRVPTESYYKSNYGRHLREVIPKHLHPSYLDTVRLHNIQI